MCWLLLCGGILVWYLLCCTDFGQQINHALLVGVMGRGAVRVARVKVHVAEQAYSYCPLLPQVNRWNGEGNMLPLLHAPLPIVATLTAPLPSLMGPAVIQQA